MAKKNHIKNDAAVRHVHIRDDSGRGIATVAYEPVLQDSRGNPCGSFARVAVANCNPQDQFDRKVGRELSTKYLRKGRSILLPIFDWGDAAHFLRNMYGV